MTVYKVSPICLSDKSLDDVQLFRIGTFFHSQYGKFDITPEILKAMEGNFKANVRGMDLAIDYSHESEDIAAGWIKSVYLNEDGTQLWAKVDWTPSGAKVIGDKEFRYISPEFSFDYKDNETLKQYGPTLLGAGLTNRPTIKKMEPVVELTEFSLADSQNEALQKARQARSSQYGIEVTTDSALTPPAGQPTEESKYGDPVNYKFPMSDASQAGNARVRFKQFANQIYKENSSKAKVHERIVKRELELGVQPDFDQNDPLDALLSGDLKSKLMKKGTKKLMDTSNVTPDMIDKMSPEELKALCLKLLAEDQAEPADQGAMMADMKNKLAAAEKQLAEYQAAKQCSEKKEAFAKLLCEGKVCKAQEEAYLSGDVQKFASLSATVKLSETGTAAPSEKMTVVTQADAELEIIRLAEKLIGEKKATSLIEAQRMVLSENKELADKYFA